MSVISQLHFYSALIFANLITLAHFSVSSAMRFPNSAGVIDNGSTPKPIRRAFIVVLSTMALISLLSFSISGRGALGRANAIPAGCIIAR